MKQREEASGRSGCALLLVLLLTGCGDGLSKGVLKELIASEYKDSRKMCWALKEMNGQEFPLRLVRGFDGGPSNHPIIKGLMAAGYVTIQEGYEGFYPVESVDLTEKGKDEEVWDAQKGFCIGHKEVDEILEWTEPGENEKKTKVTYTWEMVDRPDWVSAEFFGHIDGIKEPEKAQFVAVKTSNGWQLSGDPGDLMMNLLMQQ